MGGRGIADGVGLGAAVHGTVGVSGAAPRDRIALVPLGQRGGIEDLPLIRILTRHPLQEAIVYLVYVSRKYLPLKTRAFIDFAVEHVARLPSPSVPR